MPYFWRITLVYLGGIVLCAVLLPLLSYGFEAYLQKPMPKGAGAVGLLIPAMMAGMSVTKRLGDRPLAREMWGMSLWFAIIQFLVTALALWAIGFFSLPETVAKTKDEAFVLLGSIIMVGLFGFLVLTSRLGLGIGVRTGVKTLQRTGQT